MNAADLLAFEESIAESFNRGEIRAPVHLSSGNEQQLIDYFKNVQPDDWICCTWRSHLHCLLKGVPPDELRAAIMAGRSISLCFPKFRIVSSAIAGGILPIAAGIALGIKRAGGKERVHCFVGDMMARSGIAYESITYANFHGLPIKFVVEDNGISVCTDTNDVWGFSPVWTRLWYQRFVDNGLVLTYRYKSRWPHAGAGKRIQF